MRINIKTPQAQSEEALARITQIFHYMERIGKLQHGVMLPFGVNVSQIKEGDQLWQPWTEEERQYIRGVRNTFAHARYSVLQNGALRVTDRSPRRSGRPDMHGLHFDQEITNWEWSAQEFQGFSERLETLVLQRFQCCFLVTVTCKTCGKSVDGWDYLTCGHVKYPEGSKGSGMSKPKGATLRVEASLDYRDEMKDKFEGASMKGVVTYDGLDAIIAELERIDKIAKEEESKGTPLYEKNIK